MTAAEYAVICLILLIIISVGLLPGILFGLVAGLVLFVVDYSKVDIVKNALTGADFHSNVDRSEERRQFLEKHGKSILIYRLQGFVFLEPPTACASRSSKRLNTPGEVKATHLIIDFWRVTGLDTSAVVSFQKLAHFARVRGVAMILTGSNELSQETFLRSGLQSGDFGHVIMFADLDRGIEWCEDQLLATIQPEGREPANYSVNEQLAQVIQDKKLAVKLAKHLERTEFEPDAVMISQDSPSEEMYFIEFGPGDRRSQGRQ